MPTRERLILLARFDGATPHQIRRMLHCSTEDADCRSDAMLEKYGIGTKCRIDESASGPDAPNLTFEAIMLTTDTPIGFAGGESEAGFIKLQHYMTAEQIQALLNLRGAVLKVTIEEAQ